VVITVAFIGYVVAGPFGAERLVAMKEVMTTITRPAGASRPDRPCELLSKHRGSANNLSGGDR